MTQPDAKPPGPGLTDEAVVEGHDLIDRAEKEEQKVRPSSCAGEVSDH